MAAILYTLVMYGLPLALLLLVIFGVARWMRAGSPELDLSDLS